MKLTPPAGRFLPLMMSPVILIELAPWQVINVALSHKPVTGAGQRVLGVWQLRNRTGH
jgi:hypothetical protein